MALFVLSFPLFVCFLMSLSVPLDISWHYYFFRSSVCIVLLNAVCCCCLPLASSRLCRFSSIRIVFVVFSSNFCYVRFETYGHSLFLSLSLPLTCSRLQIILLMGFSIVPMEMIYHSIYNVLYAYAHSTTTVNSFCCCCCCRCWFRIHFDFEIVNMIDILWM